MNSVRGDGPASPASAPTAIAGGSAGKRRANSKLGQMRFMQRAAQKVAATAVNDQTPAEQDPMRWEASADGDGGGGGCVVISEDAPLPGAGHGHMSFGGFSPALEAMQAEVETARAAAAAQRAEPADSTTGAVISDEAMAAALARAQQRAGDGGAGAASGFQRPAAMAAVHFGAGSSARTPAAGIMPAAGNGNAEAAAAAPTAAAAATGAPAGAGSPDEASREQDQPDGDGILRFGADPAQQGGQKRRKKKRKQQQQQQQQEEGAVVPLRGPKRKKHERGPLAA